MKNYLPILLILVSASCSITKADEKARGMTPVAPKFLLEILPTKPEGYTLKKSKAWTGLGLWLETVATRQFAELPKEGATEEENSELAITTITIKDTAKFKGGEIDLFANFRPFKHPERNYEYLYIRRFPAFVSEKNDGRKLHIKMLVAERFILEVTMENQEKSDLKNWLSKMELRKLGAVRDGPVRRLPETFASISIDELDPKRSRTTTASAAATELIDVAEDENDNVDGE